MANIDNPRGLRSLNRCLSGGAPQVEEFAKVVGYNKAIFPGDACNQVADGSIEISATPGTTRYTGVVLGGYAPVLTASLHLVIVTPDACYEAQATTLAAADRGMNANLVLTAGDATLKRSKHSIDGATVDTTNTLDMKLHKLMPIPGNVAGAYSAWETSFNKSRGAQNVAGV